MGAGMGRSIPNQSLRIFSRTMESGIEYRLKILRQSMRWSRLTGIQPAPITRCWSHVAGRLFRAKCKRVLFSISTEATWRTATQPDISLRYFACRGEVVWQEGRAAEGSWRQGRKILARAFGGDRPGICCQTGRGNLERPVSRAMWIL